MNMSQCCRNHVSEIVYAKKTPQTCCQPSGHFLLGNLAVMKAKLKGLVMFWTMAGFQWGFDVKVQMFFLQNTTLTRLG